MDSIRGYSYQNELRGRWKTSLLILVVIFVIYVIAVGSTLWLFWLILRFFTFDLAMHPLTMLVEPGFMALTLGLATVLAVVHYYDARFNGARTIRDTLRATPPDPRDRYHTEFDNLTHELAIASGIPVLRTLVIPTHAINSLAIIDADGVPVVMATEGLLAECTRDEIQAAIAHELAHILSGDTFHVTLVCSLAGFFERLKQSFEADHRTARNWGVDARAQAAHDAGATIVSAWIGLFASLLRLLSCMMSREREYLADARAVDMTRDPRALARMIYKAKARPSFIGDFSMAVSPLFIVASSDEEGEAGLLATHPPTARRIEALARMAYTEVNDIVREAYEQQRARQEARREVCLTPEVADAETATAPADTPMLSPADERVWQMRDFRGEWLAPMTLAELAEQKTFNRNAVVRHAQRHETGRAAEFAIIHNFLTTGSLPTATQATGKGRCPRGHGPLRKETFEGVEIEVCPVCRGRAVRSRDDVSKILTRRETRFSPALVKKANDASHALMLNPAKLRGAVAQLNCDCPGCGRSMTARPYNYQYFLPIDECHNCGSIWFDSDELEMLQIWVERRVSIEALGKEQPITLG